MDKTRESRDDEEGPVGHGFISPGGEGSSTGLRGEMWGATMRKEQWAWLIHLESEINCIAVVESVES